MDIIQLVEMRNGQPMTTSRLIAWKFGKEHHRVLRAINNLKCSKEFNDTNFGVVAYKDKKGELRKEYAITKDGFVFLVMGFTGKKAAKFKEDYINEFNRMSNQLQPVDPMQKVLDSIRWLTEQVESKEKEIAVLTPKADYHDKVLQSKTSMTTTEVATELEMSARKLNAELHNRRIHFKQSGRWILYSQYQNKGLTTSRTHYYEDSNKNVQTNTITVWTEKGRRFIHNLFSQNPTLT